MHNLFRSQRRAAGLLPLLTLGSLTAVMPASAQTTITVGAADPTNPTNVPFGTGGQYSQGQASEYEQLYSGSAFSSPVSINTVSFSSGNFVGNTTEAVTYNVSVFLSNTTATANTLSSTFSDNYGSNRTLVFSGTLPAALTNTNSFDLNIPVVPNTFVFNNSSAAGSNLLFDVFINGETDSAIPPNNFEFFQGTSSDLTDSVFYSDYPADNNSVVSPGGLLTQFTVTPAILPATPEPSSLLALALGVAGTAGLVARKRRQA